MLKSEVPLVEGEIWRRVDAVAIRPVMTIELADLEDPLPGQGKRHCCLFFKEPSLDLGDVSGCLAIATQGNLHALPCEPISITGTNILPCSIIEVHLAIEASSYQDSVDHHVLHMIGSITPRIDMHVACVIGELNLLALDKSSFRAPRVANTHDTHEEGFDSISRLNNTPRAR